MTGVKGRRLGAVLATVGMLVAASIAGGHLMLGSRSGPTGARSPLPSRGTLGNGGPVGDGGVVSDGGVERYSGGLGGEPFTGTRTGAPGLTASPRPPVSPRPPGPPSPGGGVDLRGTISMTGSAGVALTFDDGPVWVATEQILTLLREHGVKATFCVLGKMAATYPERIQQIVRDGHTLCNHSWGHEADLGLRSEAEIRDNLQRANDAIRVAVPGARISYFRQPFGRWTPRSIQVAKEMGMTSMHWDVDPRDWERPGASVIADRVITRARAGSIVLLHDGGGDRSGTIEALRTIVPTLKARFALVAMPPRTPAP